MQLGITLMSKIKQGLQRLARKFGYEVVRVNPSPPHEPPNLAPPIYAAKDVPIMKPLAIDEYEKVCPAILREPKKVPTDYPIKAHAAWPMRSKT